jgi:hypothetical protein
MSETGRLQSSIKRRLIPPRFALAADGRDGIGEMQGYNRRANSGA